MARHERRELWALAADELAAGDRLRVEAHVAGCPECAGELERVRQSRAVLHEARAVEPDVRWDAVGARLRAAAARRLAKEQPRPRWPWALAMAGACAAMLAFWMLRPVAAPGGAVQPVVELPAALPETAVAVREDAVEVTATQAESAAGAVLKETGGVEKALQPGMRLRSGVAVRTPARSSASLRLPDASRVRLSAGSEVELSRAEARDVHLTVKQGRLSVQASHAERRGFLVEAAGLRVSVVGTVFTVERTEQGAAVAVAEGRVRVEVAGQEPRLVSAGERVELQAEERLLKPQPLSEPDQRAFEELSAPGEPSAVAPDTAVPAGASEPGVQADAVPAMAHAPQAPAAVRPAAATPRPQRRSPVLSEAPRPLERPVETGKGPGLLGGMEAAAPAPTAVAGGSVGRAAQTDPSQEFAPYPAASVADSLPPKVAQVPAPPAPPVEVAERLPPKKKEPLIPMELLSKDSDERFLGYARMKLNPRSCEGFLVGLEEIAKKSPRAGHREQARYLRARCFEEKLQPEAAQGEYRQYLSEFPRGRYVREARTALLP